MTDSPKKGQPDKAAKGKSPSADAEWTHGLKKLYDSVVDEPLPDSFQDLLAKLDAGE